MAAVAADRLTTEDRAVLAQASGMLTIFEDPISFEIMDKAMMTPCGHSFSEESIMGWLQTHRHCPLCNKTLRKTEVLPNYALRTAIGRFLTAQRRLHASIQNGASSLGDCYTPSPPPSTELNLEDWKTIRIEDNFEGELTMTDSKLLVEVISARDLKTDWFGNTDPYCVLEFQDQKKRTKVIHKNRTPKWEETFVFNVTNIHSEENLVITLYDRDRILKDSFLGMILISLSEVITTVKLVRRFPLQKKRPNSRRKIRGDILLRLQFLDLRKSYEAGRSDRPNGLSSLSAPPSISLSPTLHPPPINIPLHMSNPNALNIRDSNNRQPLPPPPLPPRHSLWIRGDPLHLDDVPPPVPLPPPPVVDDPPPPPPLDPLPLPQVDDHLQVALQLDQLHLDGVAEADEAEEFELVDLRFRNNNNNINGNNEELPKEDGPNQPNNELENDENNNYPQLDNPNNYNHNNNVNINNNNPDNENNDVNNLQQENQFAEFMTQMRKFDQFENELSDIAQKVDEDDVESSESHLHNFRHNEKDEEPGEMHYDSTSNVYSNNNNNSSNSSNNEHDNYHDDNDNDNDNDDNEDNEDEDSEEHLHRSHRRSHLVEAVNHPLADSASNVPPPSLTSLVSGNAEVPAYMHVVVSEGNVSALMDMGFQRNLAEFALKTCGNDFDSALDRLLNHPEELQLDILKSLFFFS